MVRYFNRRNHLRSNIVLDFMNTETTALMLETTAQLLRQKIDLLERERDEARKLVDGLAK